MGTLKALLVSPLRDTKLLGFSFTLSEIISVCQLGCHMTWRFYDVIQNWVFWKLIFRTQKVSNTSYSVYGMG